MNSKKSRQGRSGIMKRAGSFLNKNDEKLEINYYHTGDINVQTPVYLAPSASVAGNITSPVVVVAGRIHGVIAADTVVIDEGGHVWGDIYSSEFHLQPGGKCYGWVISLDQGTIELLRSGAISRDDVPAAGERPVPAEFSEEHAIDENQLPVDPQQQRFILRHLQAELAAAQLARIEIELAFDERLEEVIGQRELRQQLEIELRESIEAAGIEDGPAQHGDSAPVKGRISTDAITNEAQAEFEHEIRRYKLKVATCLEQLAWYRVLKAASESELGQLRHELMIYTEENDRFRRESTESKPQETKPPDENLAQDPENIKQLKKRLAEAQLRIDELKADLTYYRHLDRGSDK